MTSLTSQLKARLAFDDDDFILNYEGTYEGHGGMLYLSVPTAVARANSRLQPLHALLLNCVEALEHFERIGNMGYEDVVMCFAEDPSNIDYAKQALTKLRAEISGKGEL